MGVDLPRNLTSGYIHQCNEAKAYVSFFILKNTAASFVRKGPVRSTGLSSRVTTRVQHPEVNPFANQCGVAISQEHMKSTALPGIN